MESIIEMSRARDAERADLPYRFSGNPATARRWADAVGRLANLSKTQPSKHDGKKRS